MIRLADEGFTDDDEVAQLATVFGASELGTASGSTPANVIKNARVDVNTLSSLQPLEMSLQEREGEWLLSTLSPFIFSEFLSHSDRIMGRARTRSFEKRLFYLLLSRFSWFVIRMLFRCTRWAKPPMIGPFRDGFSCSSLPSMQVWHTALSQYLQIRHMHTPSLLNN